MSWKIVKNKKGTTDRIPPKGNDSWLAFWESKKNKKASNCEALGCSNDAEVGSHVYIKGTTAKEYIIPFCKECNNAEDDKEFEVYSGDLVEVTEL